MATTLNFEIEVSPRGGSEYEVTARAPDGGEASAAMHFPVSADELSRQASIIKHAVLASAAVTRRIATPDEQPVQVLGRQLFDALVPGDVRGLYRATYQDAKQDDRMLRVVLRISAPELASLPWEFLFDSGHEDYLSLNLPVVRYPPRVLEPIKPMGVTPPLRILGMAALPGDRTELEVAAEKQRLGNALASLEREGLVEVTWARGQTYANLEAAMDEGPWHIFHFIGHGGFDRESDEGTIALSDAEGRSDHVGADDLSRLLGGHRPLRLVVLNACETGQESTLGSFSSSAGALVHRGIPAVVAMQFEITDGAATEFARAFYSNIAKRLPVDICVQRARIAVKRAKKGTLEWGTPVLYLRSRGGRIFGEGGVPSPRAPHKRAGHPAAPTNLDSDPLELSYTEGLDAFWTKAWDSAVDIFRNIVAQKPGYKDSEAKLQEARRQQKLKAAYDHACEAYDAGAWSEAIEQFEVVVGEDSRYEEAADRLESARRELVIAGLVTEARQLFEAKRFEAVLAVGERLVAIAPHSSDVQELMTAARAEVAAAERTEFLAARYKQALDKLEAGAWSEAQAKLQAVSSVDAGYRNTQALLMTVGERLSKEDYAAAKSPTAVAPKKIAASNAPTLGQQLLEMSHSLWANAVAFSPDGRRLAGSTDITARIWDAATGKQLLEVSHTKSVTCVAFSPDGRKLATGSQDKTARIWDAATGKQLLQVAHSGWLNWVCGVAFSPAGLRLATCSHDKTARIWDATTGEQLLEMRHGNLVDGVAFSPDGRRLATGGQDNTARIWDAATGEQLLQMRGITAADGARGVAFSPDGRRLATGDNKVRIWDVDEHRHD
jgi:tetratricopeptide (TPR) repeat protein